MYDSEKGKEFIEKQFEEKVIPSLIQFIKIPNISRTFDPEWQTNGKLRQAAEHIKSWVQSIKIKGLKSQIIHDKGYSPLIFTQIQGDIPVTIFFYGHFDKQPQMVGWNEGMGATIPVIKDGKLYGRGGADDGYSTYSTMLAIKALQQQNLPIPRCVMITQGDQESGSGHMPHYLQTLAKRIGTPQICFCLDSGTFDYERLWLTNSLRGNLVGTLSVQTMANGIHSGDGSGIVPSCFRIAKMILARIQDPQTGDILPEFLHVDTPPQYYKQSYDMSFTKGQQAIKSYGLLEGCQQVSSNTLTSLLNRSWRPTLTVTGQSDFPKAEGSGNVLHPKIQIRFSIRLPPTLDGNMAAKKLKQVMQKNPPYGAKVQLKDVRAGFGWVAPKYQNFLSEAIKESSRLYYKNQVLNCGQGGSIPLMNSLSQIWPNSQFLITGVLGPNSNAHGPNQFLHIDYTKKLTCCMGYILAKCCQKFQKKKQ